MGNDIEAARIAARDSFERLLAEVDDGRARRLWDFERRLWSSLLGLGRALVVLFLVRQAQRPRPTVYRAGGSQYLLEGHRTSSVATRFGKVDFTRPIGRLADARSAAADLPVDRELGLCSGFSPAVVMAMTRLCAQLAFLPARSMFRYFHEWTPSSRAVLRMVDAVGDEARPFLEALPPPKGEGEVLVLEVDGGGAPTIHHRELRRRRKRHQRRHPGTTRRHHRHAKRHGNTHKRRRKGEKSKNAKVAFVGVLYSLRTTPAGREGPINKRIIATFESHEALFKWLQREAIKRGYGLKPCLFLADGSDHIWRLQQKYLPLAEVCIDWFHIIEKVWAAGECLHPEGSKQLTAWVKQLKSLLRRGSHRTVITTLCRALRRVPKTGPGNKGKRERLSKVIRHLFKHRHRLRYDELRKRDLVIGTGAVEGAVRNLVRLRLDGPGMRWGLERSERILHLRCVLISNLWDELSTHVADLPSLKLRGAPIPASPYDATRRLAA